MVSGEQKVRFDEGNNLNSAIEGFYGQIRKGQAGNLSLSLKLTGLLEEINRKIRAGSVG